MFFPSKTNKALAFFLLFFSSLCLFEGDGFRQDSELRLSFDPGYSHRPVAAALGKTVLVAWEDERNGSWEIYYRVSFDNGETWGSEKNLSPADGKSSRGASLAAKGETLHAAWHEEEGDKCWESVYSVFSPEKDSFSPPEYFSEKDNVTSSGPVLVSCGKGLLAAWTQHSGCLLKEVGYAVSLGNSTGWTVGGLTKQDAVVSVGPSLSSCGEIVHAAWEDYSTGEAEIQYARSTDSGETWKGPMVLSSMDGVRANAVSLSCFGENVHACWEDYSGEKPEVFYGFSSDGGETWSEPVALTQDDGFASQYPKISAIESDVYVFWQDQRGGNWEIYYVFSRNGGKDWSGVREFTADDGANSLSPFFAFSGPFLHVFWEDYRDGNQEIYYWRLGR